MTLEEAIEHLEPINFPGEYNLDRVHIEAIGLGIEALKVFKLARAIVGDGNYSLLPGETEE